MPTLFKIPVFGIPGSPGQMMNQIYFQKKPFVCEIPRKVTRLLAKNSGVFPGLFNEVIKQVSSEKHSLLSKFQRTIYKFQQIA